MSLWVCLVFPIGHLSRDREEQEIMNGRARRRGGSIQPMCV